MFYLGHYNDDWITDHRRCLKRSLQTRVDCIKNMFAIIFVWSQLYDTKANFRLDSCYFESFKAHIFFLETSKHYCKFLFSPGSIKQTQAQSQPWQTFFVLFHCGLPLVDNLFFWHHLLPVFQYFWLDVMFTINQLYSDNIVRWHHHHIASLFSYNIKIRKNKNLGKIICRK